MYNYWNLSVAKIPSFILTFVHSYIITLTEIFSHPDYTVGFGISPNLPFGLWAIATGRDLPPALKIVI